MSTMVALLRGINVGGRNSVPMKELRTELTAMGLTDVATLIQSGNVVFGAPQRAGARLAEAIADRVEEVFKVHPTVMLRSVDELEAVVANNPFHEPGVDSAKLHVAFLAKQPTAKAVARLDPDRSPPDAFAVHGKEIYLQLPNGIGRSKLGGDFFESRLGIPATTRNWRTVTKLLELARTAHDGS